MNFKMAKYLLLFLMAFLLIGCNNADSKFTIKIYSGISQEPEEVLIKQGDTFEEPTSPIKSDNEFLGWYYDEELTTPVTWPITIDEDINLYAKWKCYTITWVNYDGTVLEEDKVLFGESAAYDGENPTKPFSDEFGYIFKEFSIDDITQVFKDITSTAVFDEVKIRIGDLYTEANGGNIDAFYILLNLYENYGSNDSLTALTSVNPSNLSLLAEDGEIDAYYYLTRISDLGNDLARQELSNFDLSKFIAKANLGDTSAFNFLVDFYQENGIDGYETFNQMDIQGFLGNEEDFSSAYQVVVTLGLMFDNQEAITALEKSITDLVLLEIYLIFGKSILNDYNVEDLVELVDVEALKEAYEGSSWEYELILKYLTMYGKDGAYQALIEYSYARSSGIEIVIELITAENSDTIISDLIGLALYGNKKAIQFFSEQVYNKESQFYDESIMVLLELVNNGDREALRDLDYSGNGELLTNLSVDYMINIIRANPEESNDKYFNMLRDLHDDHNNINAYIGVIDLIAEGNQEAYEFLLGRYDYYSFEQYLADYLFFLLDNEDNKYLLAFTFQFIHEGFDFYTFLDDAQVVSFFEKYIALMENMDDYDFIMEHTYKILDVPTIINAVNGGNKYALVILATYAYDPEMNLEEYNINYDSLIALAEAGDSEILSFFVMYYQGILFPESELATLDVSAYYDQIQSGDISSVDEITLLSGIYDNPYANTICNYLRNDGITSLLNKLLLVGTEQDYIDIFWVGELDYLFDIGVINSSMHNLDLTILFNRIENGDIEAYDLFVIMSQEYDILMADSISSLSLSTIIELIENGDFRLYGLLSDLALENSHFGALNSMYSLQVPKFSENYYNENGYDNFIDDALYDLAVKYYNLSALESLAMWASKDYTALARLLPILELSYEYHLSVELFDLLTDEYQLDIYYLDYDVYKDMILSGNQLVLDIVSEMLLEGHGGARDLMNSIVSLEYQPAINQVVEMAESGSEFAFQILSKNNLNDVISELDVSSYVNVIEQAGEGWDIQFYLLYVLASEYDNSNAINALETLNPAMVIDCDLNDEFTSYTKLSALIEYNNQTAIEIYMDYAFEGNEEAKSILFRIPSNNSIHLSEFLNDIVEMANQNCEYSISYLFYLADSGVNEANQAILDLVENNNKIAINRIFHKSEYEDLVISLIEENNIIAVRNLIDFGYEFTNTSIRDLLIENGYID